MLHSLLGLSAGAALPLNLALSRRAWAGGTTKSPFNPAQRRALSAASERILPGSLEAGVPDYLDYWMARKPFSQYIEPLLSVGAVHLDRLAQKDHGRAYGDCKPAQQDALLKRFQAGEIKARKFNSRGFFEHLTRFTLEGFLGDPKYGGNRNQVGWKFINRCECWWQPRRLDMIKNPNGGLPW